MRQTTSNILHCCSTVVFKSMTHRLNIDPQIDFEQSTSNSGISSSRSFPFLIVSSHVSPCLLIFLSISLIPVAFRVFPIHPCLFPTQSLSLSKIPFSLISFLPPSICLLSHLPFFLAPPCLFLCLLSLSPVPIFCFHIIPFGFGSIIHFLGPYDLGGHSKAV